MDELDGVPFKEAKLVDRLVRAKERLGAVSGFLHDHRRQVSLMVIWRPAHPERTVEQFFENLRVALARFLSLSLGLLSVLPEGERWAGEVPRSAAPC